MMTKPKSVINNLRLAAEWYAKHGYYVFPLLPGTKTPATPNGLNDATTELAQIRRWWSANPNYNIGINCGASGLLVVDADTYKENAGALLLSPTITAHTAHGGTHHWYRMPAGKRYGNSRGTLPKWLDIRGFGGYVVAPPSVLIEDGVELPYSFAPGRKPNDIQPADLPTDIAAILEAAQAAREAVPANFTVDYAAAPDLAQWRLSDNILDLIHNGAAKGGRSEADQSVITALARANATDDEIRAVFVHYPIGEKYREKGNSGDKYLAYSIGKARAWLEEHLPSAQPSSTLLRDLHNLRSWAQSADFTEMLRGRNIAQPADYAKTMIAIINYAIKRGAPRVLLGSHQLGELINRDHMTAKRHLAMFGADGLDIKTKGKPPRHRDGLCLLGVTLDPDGHGKWVDLSNLLQSVNLLNLSTSVEEVNTSQQFANDHLQDEAFVRYPRHFAVKMRPNAEILPYGLSATALFIAATLSQHGELTRAAISALTGLSQYTVGKMLRRMDDMGLLVVWQGRPYRYDIHPNFEKVLDDVRPLLPSYGITERRGKVRSAARAAYCDRQLEADCRMPEDREKARLRARRDRYNKAEADYIAQMEEKGLDPWVKLVFRRPSPTIVEDDLSALTLEELAALDPDPPKKAPRPYMKIDHGEEWVSLHRPIYEQWEELAPMSHEDRYRMLGVAGYERKEIDEARHMAAKMGRGLHTFVGVVEPRAVSA